MKRLISVLTVLCLLLTAMPLSAWARPQEVSTLVNPLYADVLDREPPAVLPSDAQPLSGEFLSQDEAIVQMRGQLKNRVNSIVIKVNSDAEDRHQLAKDIFYGAMAHTGQPAEADNLRWHWTKCGWNASRRTGGGSYNYTITYSVEYYTDAAQEAELDAAVEALLDQWDHLEGASDLEKVSTIYDYITANVEYGGNAEGLQYSSYGALVNGTCVCQGYANLFYRLALELGVDNRIIPGWAGLGGHAWNLVEIDGVYYYADSTWDAGKTDYAYFLKGSMNFDKDHTPDSDYTDLLQEYPISKLDYYIGTETWPVTGACGDDLTWSLTMDGLLTISGTGAMWESAWDYPNWRQYGDRILECNIEDGVTTISKYAFSDCSILTDVSIGSSVALIDAYAFEDCGMLTGVEIPEGITAIGEGAFRNCAKLTGTAIPDGVTYIGAYAFDGCSGLTEVNIPAGVTAISEGAFSGCSGLTAVTIPEGVTAIGASAFRQCSGLTSVVIPESVTAIGASAFRQCFGLTGVNIPDGITAIADSTFYDCENLTSIRIPDSVTSIGEYAFRDCSGLTSVNIPEGVTAIGYAAFMDCWNLPCVTIPDTVAAIGSFAFSGCESLTGVTIPDGVLRISDDTFSYCYALTSVTIPDSVLIICDSAFNACDSLTDVYYGGTENTWAMIRIEAGNDCLTDAAIHCSSSDTDPEPDPLLAYGICGGDLTWILTADDTLTITGTGPMWNYHTGDAGWMPYKDRIQKCVIEDGVTTVGNYAFYQCDSMTDITIGSGVTVIGSDAFSGCNQLKDVTIGSSAAEISRFAFYGCHNMASVSIPRSVSVIEDWAFAGCYQLTDVYYGGTKTEWTQIGIGYENEYLTKAKIHYNDIDHNPPADPDEVLASGACGDNAAWSLTAGGVLTISGTGPMWDFLLGDPEWERYRDLVRKCVIEEGVTTVGTFLFENYHSLTEVIISDSVTTIGMYAFSGCSGLTDLTIGSGVTWICEWAFYGCGQLTAVTIPDSVTAIDMYAFHECRSLTEVTIPEGVTSISYAAFADCGSLTSVTIPGSVTAISEFAFYGCNDLADIYYGGTKEQWAQIRIDDGNAPLAAAAVHYTEAAPAVLYGDCSGDGQVNSLDVIRLRQYLADWDVTLDTAAADTNGDGQVNSLDVIRLRQYLADWDVTLGPQ